MIAIGKKYTPKAALTDKGVASLRAREKPYKAYDKDGLYLLVNPNGSKYWRFKCRFAQKERHCALGVYPEISLKDARQTVLKYRLDMRAGKDPAAEKQLFKKRLIVNHENTFAAVALRWHAKR